METRRQPTQSWKGGRPQEESNGGHPYRFFKAPARPRIARAALAVAAMMALMAAAFASSAPAQAQEDNDYVDVGLILEVPDDPSALLERNLDINDRRPGSESVTRQSPQTS